MDKVETAMKGQLFKIILYASAVSRRGRGRYKNGAGWSCEIKTNMNLAWQMCG